VLNETGVSPLDWFFFSFGLHRDVHELPETLSFEDLPRVANARSAKALRERFDGISSTNKYGSQRPLWQRLGRLMFRPLVTQWTLIIVEAICEIGTRYFMQQLLRRLEDSSHGPRNPWVWVVMLGLCSWGDTACDNWLSWTSNTRVLLPLIAVVQSLLYEKMMRSRKTDGRRKENGKEEKEHIPPNVLNLIEGES
jgi:hypothetical protein